MLWSPSWVLFAAIIPRRRHGGLWTTGDGLTSMAGAADADEDLGALRDLLPGFLDELGDYELLAGDLGGSLDHLLDNNTLALPSLLPPPTEDNDDKEQEPQATKRPPMQNSTRRRQKQELAYLRAKVVELERSLSELKTQLMRGRSSSTMEKSHSGGATEALALRKRTSRWERIAKHQLVEKQRAERQNLKLREVLETQIKVARSLEKVLKKRPNAMDGLDVLETDAWSKRLRSLDTSEDSLYESLLAKTDAVYAELATVCARHQAMQLDQERSDSHVHLGEHNELYMEVTSSKIVPFGLQATARAVWACLSLSRVKLADGAYYSVDSSRDRVAAKAVMKLQVSDSLALMRMRFVMKKFEEDERVVLACVSASESEGPRDVLHGLRMLERVWVVIRPVDDPEGGGGPATIVQLCMRMTPSISSDRERPGRQQEEHTGALTDLILTALHRNLGWLFQTVENILMEQVVAMP